MAGIFVKYCPICNKKMKVDDSGKNSYYEWICPDSFRIKGDPARFRHYKESSDWQTITMIAYPYRIITVKDESKIGIRSRYKTGNKRFYFKTIATCPALHPDTEEKLRNRIKLILVMS